MGRGAGRKIVQNAISHGKRHDNKSLKVKILLSRTFVVMAQAPIPAGAITRVFLQMSGSEISWLDSGVWPFLLPHHSGKERQPNEKVSGRMDILEDGLPDVRQGK